jgi:hypothetical protein
MGETESGAVLKADFLDLSPFSHNRQPNPAG